MKFKYVLLIILFVLNSAAAFIADVGYIKASSSSHESIVCNNADLTECNPIATGHCEDHDCCHQNHVHYYLPTSLPLRISISSTLYSFPPYFHLIALNSLEITKPPIV